MKSGGGMVLIVLSLRLTKVNDRLSKSSYRAVEQGHRYLHLGFPSAKRERFEQKHGGERMRKCVRTDE
jgi:hypothetical protein